jgi:hypothetical protein
MLFPKRTDYKVASTGWAHSTNYQVPLSREFWLESIQIGFHWLSTTVTMGTELADGILGLLKRVRLSVSDASGNRKVVDTTGPALLEYQQHTIGSCDRNAPRHRVGTVIATTSARGIVASPAVVTTNQYQLWYTIPFRHPQLQDPHGAATMLPLPRLSSDPVLEIETAALTDIASGSSGIFATPGKLIVKLNRRDVLSPNFPYIPTELISYDKQWNSAGGKQDWEIPAIGTVTGILIQDYNGTTSRAPVMAGSIVPVAEQEDWSLEYLSSVIRRETLASIKAENDVTNDIYSATWNNQEASYYMDFLSDYAGTDAFNLGSALDLNPLHRAQDVR